VNKNIKVILTCNLWVWASCWLCRCNVGLSITCVAESSRLCQIYRILTSSLFDEPTILIFQITTQLFSIFSQMKLPFYS